MLLFFVVERPGFLDFTGKSKHDAWTSKAGMYLDLINCLLPCYLLLKDPTPLHSDFRFCIQFCFSAFRCKHLKITSECSHPNLTCSEVFIGIKIPNRKFPYKCSILLVIGERDLLPYCSFMACIMKRFT